jgi:hypothetical protein
MTTEQKKYIIWKIIAALKGQAIAESKPFDAGDVFFSLVFKSDDELNMFAALCGVK